MQKYIKDFMFTKPELLKKYVDTSLLALNYLLIPVSAFTKHLLELQGLDPNTVPGQRELKALQAAFDKYHDDEYDTDYDASWVQKKFAKVREAGRWGDLTQETFVDLTDISNSPIRSESSGPFTIDDGRTVSTTEVNQIAPECDKREISLDTSEGRRSFRERVLSNYGQERENLKTVLKDIVKKADQVINEGTEFNPGDALARLAKAKEVLQGLKIADPIQQLADAIKEESKPSKKKTGVKISKKKLNKGAKVNRRAPTVTETQQYVAKKSSLKESIKAKIARSQKLVNEMVTKGLVTDNKEAIQEQLQQVLLMNDDAVDALVRVVEKHFSPSTTASKFTGSFRRAPRG